MTRKVCVITGSRADYGLLRLTMKEISRDSDLTLQTVATGTHLIKEYGETIREIQSDGFPIDDTVHLFPVSDCASEIASAFGRGVGGFSDVISRLDPDIILVLGDRYEIFAAVIAATIHHIPIAHCHGGELTRGSMDDSFRHAITKMSYLHLTSHELYRKRVIQLGEDPDMVINVGAFGLEAIDRGKLLEKNDLETNLGRKLGKKNILVAYHPETNAPRSIQTDFQAVLDAVGACPDLTIFFTLSNADEGGRLINEMIKRYTNKNKERAFVRPNLGQSLFFSLMRYIDGIVGNSSSGIIEAPSFGIGTLNIGDRQEGRIQGASVINCCSDKEELTKALRYLLSDSFKRGLQKCVSPYQGQDVSRRVAECLKTIELSESNTKRFFDIDFSIALASNEHLNGTS